MSENGEKKSNIREKAVPLEEKIKIFEEYLQNGEKIVGKTVYKGYPIGQWAIQIRKRVKDYYKGTRKGINPTKEQLEKLKSLGILKRQIDSTIDEKIELLIQWRKSYPNLELVGTNPPEEEIRKYAKSENDYEKLIEEYIKMQHYYRYIASRKSRGCLTSEQLEKCKEANLKSEVFGYPKYIEEFAKRYGIENKEAEYILKKYESMERFVLLYRSGLLNENDTIFARRIIRNYVDIDQSPFSQNYESLLKDLYGSNNLLMLYSSKEIDKVIESLTTRQQELLRKRYGLDAGQSKIYLKIAQEEMISKSGVGFVIQTALDRIKYNPENYSSIFVFHEIENDTEFETEKSIIEKFKEELDKSNVIFRNVDNSNNDFSENYYLKKLEFIRKLARIRKSEKRNAVLKEQEDAQNGEISVDELNLSFRSQNCLKRAGYINVTELANVISEFAENEDAVYDFLINIRGCGEKSAKEIMEKLKQVGVKIGDEVHGVNLDFIREKRDKLQEELSEIKEREKQAQQLLERYSDILGENKKFKGEE